MSCRRESSKQMTPALHLMLESESGLGNGRMLSTLLNVTGLAWITGLALP